MGSSSHFVLAMVQLSQRASLVALDPVRQLFHLPPAFEFKYYKAKSRQKVAFFQYMRSVPFRVRAVALHKTGLERGITAVSGAELTSRLIVDLAMHSPELDIASDYLIIDGATRAFLQMLRVQLSQESRRLERVRPFATIIGARSSSTEELQLADMIAGAIREYVSGEDDNYYRMFAGKVMDLWQVPDDGQ